MWNSLKKKQANNDYSLQDFENKIKNNINFDVDESLLLMIKKKNKEKFRYWFYVFK